MSFLLTTLAVAALICVVCTAAGARVPLWISVLLLTLIAIVEFVIPIAVR